jgi:hypothetical protein
VSFNFFETYPGLGQMPGFLALTNIPINDRYNLEPISYLQISGFPDISGSKSYFGMRCLGIETKHQDYWNEGYPLGRFGPKHPLLAFCSGNTTGLILNIVAITGNHLLPLRTNDPVNNNIGRKISMGLEVEQHGGVSGIFDLNISDTISDYRITPIYCWGGWWDYGTAGYHIPTYSDYKLLTIATSPKRSSVGNVASRWTHFEFEIDHKRGVIKAKIEGVDALVENKDIDINREDWDISINISGFKYDNIRLFNRTHMTGLVCGGFGASWTDPDVLNTSYYYHGAVTLYDDITLIDGTGLAPNYYVGHDSKILPLHPGITGSNPVLNRDSNVADGLLQWETNAPSHRKALTSLDKDVSIISTSISGAVNAVVYSNINNSVKPARMDGNDYPADVNSLWRTNFNDGIGGIKVYNSARKNFLDAAYVNVVRETNPDNTFNPLLYIQAENNIIRDYSRENRNINKFGNTTISNTVTLTNQSIDFTTPDSFLYVATPNLGNSSFTIESWIYLPTTAAMMLFSTIPINGILGPFVHLGVDNNNAKWADQFYSFSVHTSGIDFNLRTYRYVFQQGDYVTNLNDITSSVDRALLFPTPLVTGTWNHVAITRNSNNITCYLNGISGTSTSFDYNLVVANTSYFRDGLGGSNGLYPSWYTNIGRNGYIDQYRLTLNTSLYNSNFTPDSTTRLKRPDDYYVEFGPVHEVTRSLYVLDQFYQMTNPATNQPWSSGDIATSGLVLGVKKL